MARIKCEECGRGIGSFSFHKQLFVYQDDDGDHNFCSPECCEVWRQGRRAEWLAQQEAEGVEPGEASDDLVLLFARKSKECKDLFEAYADTGDEQVLKLARKRERELRKLETLMGTSPDKYGGELEWEKEEWEVEDDE